MQTWINFWTCFFWLSLLLFFFNPFNFLALLFYSEIVWLILYCYTVLLSNINDDILLFCTGFFLLALAGLEFCFGFLLIILYKNINQSLSLTINDKKLNQLFVVNNNKLYLHKYIYMNKH